MRAALGGVNVVGKREHARGEVVDILQSDFHHDAVLLLFHIKNVFVDGLVRAVGKRDQRAQAALKIKTLRRAVAQKASDIQLLAYAGQLGFALSRVDNSDAQSFDQVRLLAQVRRDFIKIKLDAAGKNRRVRNKRDNGAVEFGRAYLFYSRLALAYGILLRVHGAVAVHLGDQFCRERVDHGDADAVQAAGNLVSLAAKLASRVEYRHHRLERRDFGLFVYLNRDAPAVVRDTHHVARKQSHFYIVAKSAHRLVARVVKNLPHQMVQAVGARCADVHAGAAAHRLQTLQYGNVRRAVGRLFVFFFCLVCSHLNTESPSRLTPLFYQNCYRITNPLSTKIRLNLAIIWLTSASVSVRSNDWKTMR